MCRAKKAAKQEMMRRNMVRSNTSTGLKKVAKTDALNDSQAREEDLRKRREEKQRRVQKNLELQEKKAAAREQEVGVSGEGLGGKKLA